MLINALNINIVNKHVDFNERITLYYIKYLKHINTHILFSKIL